MATSLDLDRLNNEASDWFYRSAEVTFRIQRGPDLQWCFNSDGIFEVWTTEQLTPGREEYCLPELLHDDDVLQSIWLCEKCFEGEKEQFLTKGINPLVYTAYQSYLDYKECGPIDRSSVTTRRYEGYGSILVIGTKTETFCTKIPDYLVRSFAAAQVETEENVTYLSHFINTV